MRRFHKPPQRQRLTAGSWRRCWLSWFVLLLRRWIFRFRRTSWRPALRTRQLGAFFEPRLIILRCIDHQGAFHAVMAKTAKLGANYFVSAGLERREPHRNERTGDCVRRDAHVRQKEIVNHIL